MSSKDLTEIYLQQLNDYVLPDVDFKRLHHSCNSENNEYAKETLKRMHDVFVDVYGTDELDRSHGFVYVPGVIKGTENGKNALALLLLSVEDGGEHYGTQVLSIVGPLDVHRQSGLDAAITAHLYLPYDYWYTVTIPCDHHVNDCVPEDVHSLLEHCQNNTLEMEMQ